MTENKLKSNDFLSLVARYPELCRPGPQRLVVLACETGGRWGPEACGLVDRLVRLRALRAPPAVRRAAEAGWRRRWWAPASRHVGARARFVRLSRRPFRVGGGLRVPWVSLPLRKKFGFEQSQLDKMYFTKMLDENEVRGVQLMFIFPHWKNSLKKCV